MIPRCGYFNNPSLWPKACIHWRRNTCELKLPKSSQSVLGLRPVVKSQKSSFCPSDMSSFCQGQIDSFGMNGECECGRQGLQSSSEDGVCFTYRYICTVALFIDPKNILYFTFYQSLRLILRVECGVSVAVFPKYPLRLW